MAQAREIISNLSIEDAYRITKAFAIYFELTNLAETNHRKRRRRAARLQSATTPADGSFRGTLVRMKAAGISADTMLASLRKVRVTPVFTAHPTEITRHTIRLKRRRIAAYLEHLDQLPLSDSEAREYESLILAEITALWQTDEVRLNKPTGPRRNSHGTRLLPHGSFRNSAPPLRGTLRRRFARYIQHLATRRRQTCSLSARGLAATVMATPSSPAASTREALSMARHVIIDHYIAETTRLIGQLSMSTRRIGVSEALAQHGPPNTN